MLSETNSLTKILFVISIFSIFSACSKSQQDDATTPSEARSDISVTNASTDLPTESPLIYISKHKWTSGLNNPNLDSDGCKPNRYGVAMWQSFSEENGLELYSNGKLLDKSSSHENNKFSFSATTENKLRFSLIVKTLQAPNVIAQSAITEIELIDKNTISTDYSSFEMKESELEDVLNGSLTSANPNENPEKYNLITRKRTEIKCE